MRYFFMFTLLALAATAAAQSERITFAPEPGLMKVIINDAQPNTIYRVQAAQFANQVTSSTTGRVVLRMVGLVKPDDAATATTTTTTDEQDIEFTVRRQSEVIATATYRMASVNDILGAEWIEAKNWAMNQAGRTTQQKADERLRDEAAALRIIRLRKAAQLAQQSDQLDELRDDTGAF